MINIQEQGPNISSENINEFERQIGFHLPADYRSFLLSNNGGVPEKYPITFQIAGDMKLGRFLQGELSANALSKYTRTPERFVWHQVEDGVTFQLVPFDIHLITGRNIDISMFHEDQPEANAFAEDRQAAVPHDFDQIRFKPPKDSIQIFFRINGTLEISNLGWCYRALRGRIAHDLLPVASDGSGNLICMALAGTDRGSVYLWDWYSEEAPPSYNNLAFISNSFDEFLEGLRVEG